MCLFVLKIRILSGEFMEDKYKCCLLCSNSLSGDAPDGSQVLVCFECEGYEGKEMIVYEDECCNNYN